MLDISKKEIRIIIKKMATLTSAYVEPYDAYDKEIIKNNEKIISAFNIYADLLKEFSEEK